MRHNRLFAVGLTAALMLGAAAAPALAKPDKAKGKAHAYGKTKTKPEKPAQKPAQPAKKAKKTKAGVSGGGTVANGSFSIQARMRSTDKGHFNYTSTDGAFKVRCRGFQAYDTAAVSATYPRTVAVTFKSCAITGQADRGPLTVTVTDNGQVKDDQPAVAPAAPVAPDAMSFSRPGPATADGPTATTYGGNLIDGNVKIR